MNTSSCLFASSGLIAIAIVLFAAPAQWEGPVLISISPGHAISRLDAFAVVLLIGGTVWLYGCLWQRRERLMEVARRSPLAGSVVLFTGGFGLGLLIASSFSTFFWWWAIGSFLFGGVTALTIAVAMDG